MNAETEFFESILFQSLGKHLSLISFQRLAGGCIDQVVKLQTTDGIFLLKWKDHLSDQFDKENQGLALIASTNSIQVPKVLHHGSCNNCSFLLLEYIPPGTGSKNFWETFGAQLAKLHQHIHETGDYGLSHNNYIGSLPQSNTRHADWLQFFIHERLEMQLQLAHSNQLIPHRLMDRFRGFYNLLPGILSAEPPSLLHGDLWSGNYLVTQNGQAVLIDPAVYYGNREIELAFTQLFGGFDSRFYQSYFDTWAVAPGFRERADIYNLYPLLVHVNLFGTSYLGSIEQVLRRYS